MLDIAQLGWYQAKVRKETPLGFDSELVIHLPRQKSEEA